MKVNLNRLVLWHFFCMSFLHTKGEGTLMDHNALTENS